MILLINHKLDERDSNARAYKRYWKLGKINQNSSLSIILRSTGNGMRHITTLHVYSVITDEYKQLHC